MLSDPTVHLIHDSVWFDKYKYEDAEKAFHEQIAQSSIEPQDPAVRAAMEARLTKLEKENKDLKEVLNNLKNLVIRLESKVESSLTGSGRTISESQKSQPSDAGDNKDEDIDLFGSDEEDDDEKEKLKQERLKAYEEKKSKKPALIAKSNVILDVKPWDDETDMKAMEKRVREISTEGLLWGAARLVPLAYGIHKLQISSVVEDEKVSIDWLQEEIEKIEDLVQSVDIAAFNKI